MNRRTFLFTVAIFLLALGLRLWQINAEAINPDEYHWHERTNDFYHVVKEGRWEDAMVAGHPGATITWQSVISLRTLRLIYRQFDPTFDYQDYPYLSHTFNRVHFAYQLPIILITSLLIAFIFYSLQKLTNSKFASIATFLVLSNVYFLAHSRVVQMDAIQTSFIIGSVLSALLYQRQKTRIWLITTGVLLALNGMTKIYGLSILPLVWLILSWDSVGEMMRSKKIPQTIIKDSVLLTVTFLLVSILLLPSWVTNFSGTIEAFRKSIFEEGLKGAFEGNEFFFGRLYDNGEPRLFYLLAILFRQSVLTFIGLPLTLILLLTKKIKDTNIKRLILIFLLFAIYWIVILAIPSKKEDRYSLETLVFLDLVASVSFYWLFTKFEEKWPRIKNWLIPFLGLAVITIFILSTNGLENQYLGYYNPLLGGQQSAVRFIRVGWGEGMKEVTKYLNSLEDPENIRVSSWYEATVAPGCLCEVRPTFRYEEEDVTYLVFYVNQLQREKENIMIDKYFKEDNIIFESKLNDFTYAWVVKKPK